jgi:hypothetical protein
MKQLIFTFSLLFTGFVMSAERFGDLVPKDQMISIKSVLKKDSVFRGKELVVNGVVEKICVKKGCWLNLNAGDKTVRVTFKNYGIFVPSSFLGKKVALKGVFDLVEESVERRRHLMEDEGRPRSEIEKINSPLKTYSLVATGIEKI